MIDWFKGIYEKISEIIFWRSLLSKIQWVDWVTIPVIVLGTIYGARKGFLRMLVELLGLLLIIFLTFFYKDSLTIYLTGLFTLTRKPAELVSFILAALAAWFVLSVLDRYLQRWFHSNFMEPLKTIGGALLGVVHLIILWSFISQGILLIPYAPIKKSYEAGHSLTGEKIKTLAPSFYHAIRGSKAPVS